MNRAGFTSLALLLAATSALACAHPLGRAQKLLRDPGEQLADFPEKVWEQYNCADQKLPFFNIEKLQLVPNRLEAGEDFNHRLVYVLCPAQPTATIPGSLDTRILFRGQSIVREHDGSYELKPGRWVVDAFVSIPASAEAGIYSMELTFEGEDLRFERRLSFVVEARD